MAYYRNNISAMKKETETFDIREKLNGRNCIRNINKSC